VQGNLTLFTLDAHLLLEVRSMLLRQQRSFPLLRWNEHLYDRFLAMAAA
jgi:hypothetical protein